MARFSRKGWYIRTALRTGRCYREVIPSDTGDEVIDYPSEMVMRTIIEARMNWIDMSVAPVEDCPGANELLWKFRERSQYGQFIGSFLTFLTFLAPSGSDIRRIRAAQVEANKEARRATAERSEIRRAMSPVSKTRATQTDSASSQRRL